MLQRHEFVVLAGQQGPAFKELCRRFGISRKTGYKWIDRFRSGGAAALTDQPRRPHRSPLQTPSALSEAVIGLRLVNPAWGGRKLKRRLEDMGHLDVPAASTCTEILRRADLLAKEVPHGPMQRFERSSPNELWQMDHKGDFPTQRGPRCCPLTALDDHSRFNVVLAASDNQLTQTVQAALSHAFEQYGLPEAILCDNGTPWGNTDGTGHTRLSVWLLRLGVRVLHGRPYHPQTQGKEERFHRTLKNELLIRHTWRDLAHCAAEFPRYRQRYNFERPHDSLGGDTPSAHYRPSVRSLPQTLPLPEYSGMEVRVVRDKGVITFGGQTWLIGKAFASLAIGLRPSAQADGQWEVFFSFFKLGHIDLTTARFAKHILRPLLSLTPPKD
jgi:transposase InsO family protein